MQNKRKLTEDEKIKRDAIVKAMIGSNKRGLVQRYGKNAEKIAYDRANKIVAQQSESMNTKLKELVRKSLANEEAEFSKKHDDNPALKGKQKDLPDKLQKAIINKSGNLDEGFLDRVKAKVKGASTFVGTGLSNVGKAFMGKELKDPKLAAGMAKLGQKAKTLEKGLNDVINDVNILFPPTKLKEVPQLEKIISYYGSLLNQAKKINAEIAKGDLSSLEKSSSTISTTPATKPAPSTAPAKSAPSTAPAKSKTTKSKAPELKTKSGSYVKDGVAYNKDGKKLTGNVAKQVIAAIDKMKKSVAEYIIASKHGIVNEDLDLGHEDNEPHMLKADLYRIGKYAMELYKMVGQFEGKQEVDFPHWWQAKIIQAKSCLVSAKHYLDFEIKEPQIDAMVDVASEEGAIDEKLKPSMGAGAYVDDFRKSDAPQFKGKSKAKKNKMAVAAYLSAKDKIKEAILAKLQESKGEYAKIEKQIADLKSKGKNAGDAEMQKLIKRRAELEKSKK